MADFEKVLGDLKKAAEDVLNKTDIDEKAIAKYKELKGQAEAYMEKTDVDDKLKEKAKAVLDNTDLDEKLGENLEQLRKGFSK